MCSKCPPNTIVKKQCLFIIHEKPGDSNKMMSVMKTPPSGYETIEKLSIGMTYIYNDLSRKDAKIKMAQLKKLGLNVFMDDAHADL